MLRRAGAAFWGGANRTELCALHPAVPCRTLDSSSIPEANHRVQQLAGDTADFTWGSTFTPICTLVVPVLALSTLPLIPLAVQW